MAMDSYGQAGATMRQTRTPQGMSIASALPGDLGKLEEHYSYLSSIADGIRRLDSQARTAQQALFLARMDIARGCIEWRTAGQAKECYDNLMNAYKEMVR